ncbi:MAG: S8 family serine peptidase [Thermoplasmatota archaeon]
MLLSRFRIASVLAALVVALPAAAPSPVPADTLRGPILHLVDDASGTTPPVSHEPAPLPSTALAIAHARLAEAGTDASHFTSRLASAPPNAPPLPAAVGRPLVVRAMPTLLPPAVRDLVPQRFATRAPLAASDLSLHAPIVIGSDAGFLLPAALSGVIGGDGSSADPYRIEGWEIPVTNGTAIEIANTSKAWIVSRNSIHSTLDQPDEGMIGIEALNVTGGRVENNTILDATQGILLDALGFVDPSLGQPVAVARHAHFVVANNTLGDFYDYFPSTIHPALNKLSRCGSGACDAISMETAGAEIRDNVVNGAPAYRYAIEVEGEHALVARNKISSTFGIAFFGAHLSAVANEVRDAYPSGILATLWDDAEALPSGVCCGPTTRLEGNDTFVANVITFSTALTDGSGIYTEVTPDSTLDANRVWGYDDALFLDRCPRCDIESNVLGGAFQMALYGLYVGDARIVANDITGYHDAFFGPGDGIRIYALPSYDAATPYDHALVEANVVRDSFGGIVLWQDAATDADASGHHRIYANRIENDTWGLLLMASAGNTLRDNRITACRFGFLYDARTRTQAIQDIDESNTIDGVPMLLLVAPRDVTLDGATRPLSFLGIVGGAHVVAEHYAMFGGGDRFAAWDASDLKLADSRFGANFDSVQLHESPDATLANVTFTDDTVFGVYAARSPALVAHDDVFDSALPPSRFTGSSAYGIQLVATDNATLTNLTFTNRRMGVELVGVNDSTLAGIAAAGALIGVDLVGTARTVVRNVALDETVIALADVNGAADRLEQSRVTNATLGLYCSCTSFVADDDHVEYRELGIAADDQFATPSLVAEHDLVVGDEDAAASAAIFLANPVEPTRIANDTAVARTGAGVQLKESTCDTSDLRAHVTGTRIERSLTGVLVVCDDVSSLNDDVNVEVFSNVLAGNEVGMWLSEPSAQLSLPATLNWWGDASGPRAPGNDLGTGDPVKGRVLYDPWDTVRPARADDGADPGFNASAGPVDAGDPVTFRATTSAPDLLYAFGDGTLLATNATNATHAYEVAGDARALLALHASDGRIGLAFAPVTVANVAPRVGALALPYARFGEPARLTTSAFDEGYVASIDWDFGDATRAPASPAAPAAPAASTAPPAPGAGASRSTIAPDLLRAVAISAPDAKLDLIVLARDTAAPHRAALAALGTVDRAWTVVQGFEAHVEARDVARLASEPWVASLFLDEPVVSDGDVHRAVLHAREASGLGLTGDGVTIAVVDSGIDATHPDLVGKVKSAVDWSIDCQAVAPPPCAGTGDATGHGTLVAGLAAGTGVASNARFAGIAPRADLVDDKVIGSDGKTYDAYAIQGLDWLGTNAKALGVRVALLAFHRACIDCDASGDPLSQAAGNLARDDGILVVAASADTGPAPGTIGSPAVDPDVIAVGALDTRGTPTPADDFLAGFSGRGAAPGGAMKRDVVAPGVDETGPAAGGGYFPLSGTSASAAEVAGIAALLVEQDPTLTPAAAQSALRAGARHVPLDTAPTPNGDFGWGAADALGALGDVGGAPPISPLHAFALPGRYTLTLNATDDLGARTSVTSPLLVHGVLASFDAAPVDANASGERFRFTDTSRYADASLVNWTWDFGDGHDAFGPVATHTFTSDGPRIVALVATEDGANVARATRLVLVDHTMPVSVARLSGTTVDGTHFAGAVAVTLSVSGDALNRPVEHARVDGGAWMNATTFTVSASGNHTLEYGASDSLGRAEAIRAVGFSIDPSPPTIDGVYPGNRTITDGPFLAGVDAHDARHAVHDVRFVLDGRDIGSATAAPWSLTVPATWLYPGEHQLAMTVRNTYGATRVAYFSFEYAPRAPDPVGGIEDGAVTTANHGATA